MANEEKSYGWLGVDMPMEVKVRMALIQRAIDPKDLYTDKSGFGLDKNPHVTLAYGHEEDDPESTRQALTDLGSGEGKLSKLSTFDNPDYQVLKFDVDSPHLHSLNKRLKERIAMPGQTFPNYNPHVTVAYLKPGVDVEKYRKLEKLLQNRRFPVKMIRFSNPRDEYNTILLKEVLKKSAENQVSIVTGNPEYITDNPKADEFYSNLRKLLEEKGYKVNMDAGEPHTTPPETDHAWVGHSRGTDRLRFAPKNVKTIAIGAPEKEDAINHPDEGKTDEAHYTLTPEMEEAILNRLKKSAKEEVKEGNAAGQVMETDPTEAQIKAENYKKAHIEIDGLRISIENPVGSERSGTDKDGTEWTQEIWDDYGYIKGSTGYDKDHVDVFINPSLEGDPDTVYILNQLNDEDQFDEHKCLIGYASKASARASYLQNYEDDWDRDGDIIEMVWDDFKKWCMSDLPKKGACTEQCFEKVAKVLDKEYSTKEDDVDEEELRIGIEIEKEHTTDEEAAKEIALDHLHEMPDYYTRLVAMEEDAKNARMQKIAKIILDINVGDTVLVGRFKNKPIVVKDIGTDANGQPTINGRKLLSLRIKKLMPEKKKAATASASSKKMRKGKNTSKAALKMRKKANEIGEIEYNIVSGKKRYKPVDGETKEYAIRRAIAKINGLHAGSAKIVRTSDDDNVLESLNVVADHRNKGVGRELVKRLLEDADKRGTKSITLRANPYMDEPVDKEKLQEFYKTFGFESTDDDGRMIRKKAQEGREILSNVINIVEGHSKEANATKAGLIGAGIGGVLGGGAGYMMADDETKEEAAIAGSVLGAGAGAITGLTGAALLARLKHSSGSERDSYRIPKKDGLVDVKRAYKDVYGPQLSEEVSQADEAARKAGAPWSNKEKLERLLRYEEDSSLNASIDLYDYDAAGVKVPKGKRDMQTAHLPFEDPDIRRIISEPELEDAEMMSRVVGDNERVSMGIKPEEYMELLGGDESQEVMMHELNHFVTAGDHPSKSKAYTDKAMTDEGIDVGEDLWDVTYPEFRSLEATPPLSAMQHWWFKRTGDRIENDTDYEDAIRVMNATPETDLPFEVRRLKRYREHMDKRGKLESYDNVNKKLLPTIVKNSLLEFLMGDSVKKVAKEVESINTGLDILNKAVSVIEG
jgi:GNAT superfamily N-acetyltransferase/2'-5' RNA ligase